MVVIDDGTITDETQRYTQFTKKLAGYVFYASQPEFRQQYPSISPHEVLIRVICYRPPNEEMKKIKAVAPPELGGDESMRMQVEFYDKEEFMRLGEV